MKRLVWLVDSMILPSACIYWENMSMFFRSGFLMDHIVFVFKVLR